MMDTPSTTPAPAESRFTRVSGKRIEYRQFLAQDPTAPTLVFLHQGLGSVSAWRNVPQDLAQRTGCSAFWYSRPGYGWSELLSEAREPDYMQIEATQMLPQVLSAFGLNDIILVGHSDGGTIALSYLGSGGQARAVIAVAPHVRDEQVTHETIAIQRADWYSGPLRARLQRHHEDADAMFLSWTDIWLSPRFRNWSMEHLLTQVTVPSLGLQGEQDETGSMLHIETMARLINAPVELERLQNCRHDPFREYPEETLSACADFLRRHARTAC